MSSANQVSDVTNTPAAANAPEPGTTAPAASAPAATGTHEPGTAAPTTSTLATSSKYAPRARGNYDLFAAFFVAFLLLSNIAATKLISAGPLIFDGGAILFPLTYVIGDVLAEVYGFRSARRVILMGFIASIIASATFYLVALAPSAADYHDQAAFEAVLGVVPRFVAASIAGYLVGQILNAYVLTKIKDRWGERHLWARLIGSTVVGELADTIVFCLIAWLGSASLATIANLTVTGWAYKVGVEVVLLPITYTVIRVVKRHEPEYAASAERRRHAAPANQTALAGAPAPAPAAASSATPVVPNPNSTEHPNSTEEQA